MRTETLPNPAHLTRRIRDMVANGRVHAARPLLGALRKMSPPSSELTEIEARLLLREGRVHEALAQLDAGVEQDPAASALRICRADARVQINDITGAAADAAEAVILDPRSAQAKALLGTILIEMQRPTDAIPCLLEAVAAEPGRASYLRALATAQERAGDLAGAAATMDESIRRNPGDVGLRTAAIMIAMRQRAFSQAAALAETARRDGVADACVFGLLGHALSSTGRHAEATDAYAEALKLAPEDPYVRHLVTAAGLLPQAARAPSAYLEAVFDGYAARFEAHLISLGYRVPGLIRAALLAQRPALARGETLGPALDLGCGTGLMAVVLSDLAVGPLTGVDVSEGMLREARGKGLYQTLVQADLEAFLAQDETTWPLVMAADVLCYFGVLDGVLAQVHTRMQPGGLLILTVEELQDEAGEQPVQGGWRLGRQGRFAHRLDYVAQCAGQAGFSIRAATREALRSEGQADVPGLLFVLQRTHHDG